MQLALGVASRAGVEVVEAGSPGVGRSLRVEQGPPADYRSNAAWAAALMANVAGAYVRDPQEAANALEVGLSGAYRFSEDALSVRLARAVRYLGGEADGRESAEGMRERVAEAWKESGRADLGDPQSRFATARAMLRGDLVEVGSPVIDVLWDRWEPVDPEAYGDTFGGCVAWHLAEASPEFRELDPVALGRACEAAAVAQAANELLEHSGLMATQDADVGFECGDPDVRMALERHGVADGGLSMLGSLVKGQVVREYGHPLDPVRREVEPPAVEPVAFRGLDSRWPQDEAPIVDRVLSVCARSGVAVRLAAGDRVDVKQSVSEQQRDDPFPGTVSYGSYAVVEHPVPEKFPSGEEWARSLLEGVAFAVATHPRLANQVQLHGLHESWGGRGSVLNESNVFRNALHHVCLERDWDPAELMKEGATVSRGDSFPSVEALRKTGVSVPESEVERRAMWLALEEIAPDGGSSSRTYPEVQDRPPAAEGHVRPERGGDGDVTGLREAMARGHSDYRVARRVMECSYDQLNDLVKPHERWELVGERSLGDSVWESGWRPTDCDGAVGEAHRPREAVRAVDRAVAVLAADRILDRLGVAGERIDFENPRRGPRTGAFLASLEGVKGEDVVGRVRVLASDVVEFMRDERRAERWDRRSDVLHSLGVNPWADLERARARPLDVEVPAAPVRQRGGERELVR